MFWHQFKTIAKHNCWMCHEKSIYLITVSQGRATDVLHGVPKGTTYDETLEAVEDGFGYQYLAAIYRSHLKTRTQGVRESLQEFAKAVEHLAHYAYATLPEDHVRREAGKAFTDWIEDPTIKTRLSDRPLNCRPCS
jgi:hypothetical protein